MRIRHRLKYCVALGVIFVVASAIGLVSWKIEDSTQTAKALDEDEFPYEDNCCEARLFDWPEGEDVYYENTEDNSGEDDNGGLAPTGSGVLPASYDAREIYTHVRNKDQNTEGLCWLYAMTTALEFYLEKNYQDTVEISPKHFEYQLVKAADAYEDEGVENFYARDEHEFGEGGSLQLSLLGLSNPLAIISDEDFTQIVKKKDNRLSSINRYEDIWELNNYRDILTRSDGVHDEDDDKNNIYTVRQDYDEINNPDNVEYIATDTGVIRYDRENDIGRQETIEKIKNVVLEYGAAFVNTTTDSKCSYVDANGNYTFIHRSYDGEIGGNPVKMQCALSKNHEMAIVGWDDEWEYVYEGETRKGAFILQNSWGNWGGSETNRNKWHLSYNSRFPEVQYFESVERYDDYDKIYGAMDYGESTIVAGKEEYVFTFNSDDKYRKLVGFTFNEYYSGQDFDVYVSPTGLEEDFRKVGNFKPGIGVEKYVFDEGVGVEGKYAVKLEEVDDGITGSKTMNVMNVLANDAWKLDIDLNDGSGSMDRQDCEISNEGSCLVTIPNEVPVRTGYRFFGYADSANAKSAQYRPGDEILLTANKTIYAVWATGAINWQQNQAYTKGVSEDMIVKIDYPHTNFSKLLIDGVEVDTANYIVAVGSTVITIAKEHLETLEPGDHTLRAVYDNDIVADTNFSVAEAAEKPDVPDAPGVPDIPGEPDAPVAPIADLPVGPDEEDDLSVPNTAASDDYGVTGSAPDTGGNTKGGENNSSYLIYVVPVMVASMAGGVLIKRRNKGHKKFDQ